MLYTDFIMNFELIIFSISENKMKESCSDRNTRHSRRGYRTLTPGGTLNIKNWFLGLATVIAILRTIHSCLM